ncbi:MAG: C-terminal binding protein [Chloroflexi bacterium]|nr:C-terminal binding protein [Chloroflexota bacterium]
MARFRVVKLGCGAEPDTAYERSRLEPLGAEVVAARADTDEATVAALRGADGCVSYGPRFTGDIIARLDPSLWFIVHAGTGYDPVDVDAAAAAGIMVANLPFQCIDEVANSALAYVLAFNRCLVDADRHVRSGLWERSRFNAIGPIVGETLGLLGFGNIARLVARRAQAFDLRVVAYDPYVDPALARESNVALLNLEDLLRQSDYVSCHLPHNRHTHHLMNDDRFRLMKPRAIFVNTSRGKCVDEAALVRTLTEGRIAGAGLDVFEIEPLPTESPLRTLTNVLLAPHLAGTSVASAVKNRQHAVDQVVEALRDGAPSALVNRGVVSRRVARV